MGKYIDILIYRYICIYVGKFDGSVIMCGRFWKGVCENFVIYYAKVLKQIEQMFEYSFDRTNVRLVMTNSRQKEKRGKPPQIFTCALSAFR